MKWIQMQKKRYGEKRKGGYVDMGKQVRCLFPYIGGSINVIVRIFLLSMFEKLSRITVI